MKILLLEDDLELCKNIKNSLEKENYMVDCCNDGETAMLYALNTDYAYDIAIVDRMLPIIDGLTIIKSMRRKGISIPIRERFKFCVNRKTDIRYVISYRGQNLFFRVLSLFVL